MENEIIPFLRKKDFLFIKDIGQGACGKTVLLKDEIIDELFVCKKYSPADDSMKDELFNNFIQEIKLLHLLYHRNIVRVYNYYLYPESKTGYIIMEYVEGINIEEYIKNYPEKINEIFLQTIDGFNYLERENILHRDLRPYNVLIDNSGFVKIIDFGFGKQINIEQDYHKSISLNWWCDIPPSEFHNHKYDFRTEVYFVGKLFEKIIVENEIQVFSYKDVLNTMTKVDYDKRINSFNDVNRFILSNKIQELDFNYSEKKAYQTFADQFIALIGKIDSRVKYKTDIEQIIKQLEQLYKSSLLEEYLQNKVALLRCFIDGTYTYYKNKIITVESIKDFLILLKTGSKERQNIIINNLWNRLDLIERSYKKVKNDDDLPF